ncbi:MAG TPA: hypothetical protein VMK05_16480 [Burkholderiales bacterium]|nr:hypothetical protein [Burkholderiales bacterium]
MTQEHIESYVSGFKFRAGLLAAALAVIAAAPFLAGGDDGQVMAQSTLSVKSEYFPDGYVNQATRIEPQPATF